MVSLNSIQCLKAPSLYLAASPRPTNFPCGAQHGLQTKPYSAHMNPAILRPVSDLHLGEIHVKVARGSFSIEGDTILVTRVTLKGNFLKFKFSVALLR